MEINSEFNFNQIYYYNKMIRVPKTEKCLFCDKGKMKRFDDGKVVTCPLCNGSTEVESGGNIITEEPRKCHLHKILINKSSNSENIEYFFINEYTEFIKSTIYETLDDCIDRKNAYNRFNGINPYSH